MAETKNDKALRYVSERRLTVIEVGPDRIIAQCRGDSGEVYSLGWHPRRKEWRCTCEASRQFGRECSHLIALKLVTIKPTEGTEQS